MKLYIDYLDEITADEVYEKLMKTGLFSEKLPPVFDASSFYNAIAKKNTYKRSPTGFISYKNVRDINIPRNLGIPNPFSHERLCCCISNNWNNLKDYFRKETFSQSYSVSRIHIRKSLHEESLFRMNYKNWREDGNPDLDIMLGKQYLVCADISKCFPSVYTHAIPWALVGKEVAKKIKTKNYGTTNWIKWLGMKIIMKHMEY